MKSWSGFSLVPSRIAAILWAEWRALLRFRPREGRSGIVLAGLMALAWYGLWCALAAAAHSYAASARVSQLAQALPRALMLILFYWQLSPVLTASLGASLELEKLLIYPIPFRQLFLVETLLRLSTSLEIVILLSGLATGLGRNAALPAWAPLITLTAYAVANLFLAAGLRQALERLLAHRLLRELLVLVLILAAAASQILLVTGLPAWMVRLWTAPAHAWWPWTVFSRLALAMPTTWGWAMAAGWVALAWRYGRWQFARSLRLEARSASGGLRPSMRRTACMDLLFGALERVTGDPLAALVEKELRSLARTPRFRLVFLMGFTFGPLMWVPVAWGRDTAGSMLAGHYLTLLSAYALVLLGDVTFWNVLGLDRTAAQLYYLAPAPFSRVLTAKNLAALIAVVLEVAILILASLALRMPLSPGRIAEAYSVTLVSSAYLLGLGNLSSMYYPAGVDPGQPWRPSSPARLRLLLFVLYPAAAVPVSLPFLARWAFASELAFWLVLALVMAIGFAVYGVATSSAVEAACWRKEQILAALSEGRSIVGV